VARWSIPFTAISIITNSSQEMKAMKVDKAIVFDVFSVFKKIIGRIRREGLIELIRQIFHLSYMYENDLDGLK